MTQFIQLLINNFQEEQKEILIAELMMAGFEGIEEADFELKAFIQEHEFDEILLVDIKSKYSFDFTISKIASQNWNALWESNFEPVIVDDFVGIRASFHKHIAAVAYEIVITPKMSFGTGHHATTYMMVQQMCSLDFKNKTVFDFGTGTGILAILAEKMGAASVFAIDNDEWSIFNFEENIQTNQCNRIEFKKTEAIDQTKQYDIILANINKNVIIDNLQALFTIMKPDSILLLSGLLTSDEKDICEAANKFSLQQIVLIERNNWICLQFQR